MNKDITGRILITFLILGSIWAIVYNFYMSWFRPSAFLDRASKGVKDWWPFADFFRSYYGSPWWLWITRIWATFFLGFLIYILYRVVFG